MDVYLHCHDVISVKNLDKFSSNYYTLYCYDNMLHHTFTRPVVILLLVRTGKVESFSLVYVSLSIFSLSLSLSLSLPASPYLSLTW